MEVEQGEIVGFLGPNGAGKTTSFYMITGQIVPNAGRIFLDDEDITELPMYRRSQKGLPAAGSFRIPQNERGGQHHVGDGTVQHDEGRAE